MFRLRNIKITHIYFIMLIILIIMIFIVGSSMKKSSENLKEMQDNTAAYIYLEDAISGMRDASDYLTEHCRDYVISGDEDHLERFFWEINDNKRREKAINAVLDYSESNDISKALGKSLSASNKLIKTEKYAMKLAAIGHNSTDSSIDKYLADVVISDEDMELSDDQKISKATDLVFNDDYNRRKETIKDGVYRSLAELIEQTKQDQLNNYEFERKVLRREHIVFFLMIILSGIMLLLTAVGIIVPIETSVAYIKKNEKIPERGSKEYAFLAEAYNSMLEKNLENSAMLSYEASHDELTGLYNRKTFEDVRKAKAEENTALILFDIDHFKQINDTYGHETGDKILRKVADALAGSFRNDDYVCRIGGDEFAVIMVNMTPENESVLEEKVNIVKEKIRENERMHHTTLSIGAAFSDDTHDREQLFIKADEALYKVKKNGRNGFAVYSEQDDSRAQKL